MRSFHGTAKLIALAVLGTGCLADTSVTVSSGNEALGIATFETTETEEATTVVGLAADGSEVGRLVLVHGPFSTTGVFRDDFGPSLVGRKLDVDVGGEKLVFETPGYEPVPHMPPHPDGMTRLAAFLADPHTSAVLGRWQLGFDSVMPDGEAGYTSGTWTGTNAVFYAGAVSTYGTSGRGLTMGVCGMGSNGIVDKAIKVKHTTPNDEYFIAQICPDPAGQWFGAKACPNTGTTSTCGTASGACVSCASYYGAGSYGPGLSPTNGSASMNTTSTGLQFCYNESTPNLALTMGTNSGTVTSNIPGFSGSTGGVTTNTATCTNAPITLTRTDTFLDFSGWTGGCTGTGNTCTVTMSAAKSVTASYALTVQSTSNTRSGPTRTSNSINVPTTNVASVTMAGPGPYFFQNVGSSCFQWSSGSTSFSCGRITGGGSATVNVTDSATGKMRTFNLTFN